MQKWIFLSSLVFCVAACSPVTQWNEFERRAITSLAITSLPPVPPDQSNSIASHPIAVEFGQALFHDVRLSANQQVSCASCHRPDYFFSDDKPQSRGLAATRRHTPGLIGIAYSQWLYWDGRRDSLWAQALTPLEHPDEHGISRVQVTELISTDPHYRQLYQELYGGLYGESAAGNHTTDRMFANAGKAIAAFETTLLPKPSRFDRYAAALVSSDWGTVDRALFSDEEIAGLRLFVNKAQCLNCHNGALFTNQGFHNVGTGLGVSAALPDHGRWQGVQEAQADPFNCLGEFSDAPAEWCALKFARVGGPELMGAFKVPGLRNISQTPPYMHDGRFSTLAQVVDHYIAAIPVPMGHTEIVPIPLAETERNNLIKFLETL